MHRRPLAEIAVKPRLEPNAVSVDASRVLKRSGAAVPRSRGNWAMTAISTCPDEPELLSVATGEPVGEAIQRHLDACPICAGRVELLRAELMAPYHDLGEGLIPRRPSRSRR